MVWKKTMRQRAEYNQRFDSATRSVVTGVVGGIVFISLRALVSNPMAAGITVFVTVIVHASLGGLFQIRAWRIYVKVLALTLLTSFLAGYVVFLFDLD
jgi:hypothetical protein